MPKARSFRSRLALGYAGIALLTVLLLGAILALALPPYFAQVEQNYLRSATADALNHLKEAGGLGPAKSGSLAPTVRRIALADRVRIRVSDPAGNVLIDSGPVGDPASVSTQSHTEPVVSADGRSVGRIDVTGGPKQGAGLTASIGWAWGVACLFAVGISAASGYALARRVSKPIAELTRASNQMARGDLSVRAEVTGDTEARALATAFNEMAQGNENTFVSLKRFIGDAAHEIGTPLTALQADLELARESPADPTLPDLLDRSLAHAARIGILTRDLLVLSRLESVGAVTEVRCVDVAGLVADAVDSVSSRAEQSEIELAVEDRARGVQVAGDPASLSRALQNLLDNALKFTPAGGSVSISIASRDGWVSLRVHDTGCGIAPDDIPHVFKRFYRARGVTPVPGSGLGLAIVKAIVDAHRGDVSVSSDVNGTTVEVRLPLAAEGFLPVTSL